MQSQAHYLAMNDGAGLAVLLWTLEAIRESNGGPVRASVIREAEDWGSADLIARVRAVRSAPTAAS